ncbi:MAG: adenosine deaminase [Deltaproteobacteria bacterium]|nr:adenosine deaminase [Deltaproteobacteria bacterium]
MKNIARLIAVCFLLTSAIARAGDHDLDERIEQYNYSATQQYYSELISGETPDVAELNLLMNMLPKGGDIHHHYSGAIYAETYLDWVEKQKYCIYRESNPALQAEKYRIETRTQLAKGARQICIDVDTVRKDDVLYRELLQVWSDKDFDNHYHEQPAPDQQFFNTFGYFGPVSSSDYNEGLKGLKARAKAENLQYLETMLKSAPEVDNPELAKRINGLSPEAGEGEIRQALTAYADFLGSDGEAQKKIGDYVKNLEAAAAGIGDNDFKLRFLSYVSRNNAPAKVFAGLYSAFAAAAQGGGLIVGVNLVGPENGHVAMRDYRLHMRMFRFLRQRFPGVRLTLHAGELVLGMVPPEGLQSHIREAVEIAGAERIGHGVDIPHEFKAAELLDILKERQIAIEVNLTSNAFILGVQNEAHPVNVYRRHNVPIVIATDDAGVSRTNLSGEYLLFVRRYKPSYPELKEIVYNSIRYSFLGEEEKIAELRLLTERFDDFEAAVEKLARTSAWGEGAPGGRPVAPGK